MSEEYAREILRRNVAQICQTIGWNGINSTPLDIMVHVLEKYIRSLGTQSNRYAEQFNRTEPNLNDLGLVFRDLHIQLPDLSEFTQSVPSVPPPVKTENFPKPKESNLNFLKPGSHEVVTRPMHVHEHLPPMYPEKEQDTPVVAGTIEICHNGVDGGETNPSRASPEISVTDSPEKPKDIFKRPIDPVSLPSNKRPRLRMDEEERTREISSVMMTMSGFLSPAREGKLPEARPPAIVSDKHDKHKANSHHSNPTKAPMLDKSDKKSKKNKLVNGKIIKSKRKDKSHKGESGKSKDNSKLDRYPPGHPTKNKDTHTTQHNNVAMPAPNVTPLQQPPRPLVPPLQTPITPAPISESPRPLGIKQEQLETHQQPTASSSRNLLPREDAIPVPRKIPISKSPLVPSTPVNKNATVTNSIIPDIQIKKEVVVEQEKLASQPDRSKINIFKRISNKSKEDKSHSDASTEKPQSESLISRLQNTAHENCSLQSHDNIANNNNSSPVDLSKVIDIRAHEVISLDDDSLDNLPTLPGLSALESKPSLSITKSLPLSNSKDFGSPKVKKDKKHKEKKDKSAKLEAKLKKQQQQLAYEMVQMPEKKKTKVGNEKSKSGRPKNQPKMPQMPPGFPFFAAMPPGRGMMPGPGLIPNPGLIPGNDFLAGLANNPALRGLPAPNLISNPFALGAGGPGLIPSSSFLPGIPNHLLPMGNFPHSSRSSTGKIPHMLRRPSLEVIPVDNDEEHMTKPPGICHDKDRHDKHKPPTVPNILQKQKSKSNKDHKTNIYRMPPVQPDITIQLNPPKPELIRQEQTREPPPPERLPTPEPAPIERPEPQIIAESTSTNTSIPNILKQELDSPEKKKDKSHKKEKRDKDGIKIKKKKDKKDKNKEKSDKKKDMEKQEEKDRIKKEKKEKRKEKSAEGLVPKLTLKLSSSNSNSPMPPSSPDIFKLNIKPVIKKEDDNSSVKEESVSREHSRSPELAQISALVTRPPKQKPVKQNQVAEPEVSVSSPPSASPSRKNHPPSSHSKYKRILIKPISKKGQADNLDEDSPVVVEDTTAPPPATDKPSGPLPTPYYVDEHGNKIWVCPACGRPDNGSPMIGCDGCDGWYHWVCVGITEEPGATEDWFCKSCIAKRAAMVLAGVTTGKKRGRKPKGEKVRDCN
ncbi:transcription initiation factor TFIID subunit 3 [Leptidea sinapis]|uniref:transcription initiation factor TFIID subunit 3 n=1 Tax=Leptidea sinapis TaxID=189913 RepID=UPI002138991C|nr:transcription initiation factor TFIID subunit 3 [Leptidea sinapis]